MISRINNISTNIEDPMNLKKLLPALLFALLALAAQAQVTLEPSFPTIDDEVTIIYDATQGVSGLAGADKVYMHSSVGIDPSGQTWEGPYTVGNWGQDDGVGQMTKRDDLGANTWSITITPRAYYSIPQGVTVFNLAMVFRNAAGNQTGKSPSNGDIFVAISPGLAIFFEQPSAESITPILGTDYEVVARGSEVGDSIVLRAAGERIAASTGTDTLRALLPIAATEQTMVTATLYQGNDVVADTFYYFGITANTAEVPAGIEDGINYVADDSVVLKLYAPGKTSAFLLADWNDWTIDPAWQLRQSPDGQYFWLPIGGLTPGQEYNFQYVVDGTIRISDPYAEKVVYEYDRGQIPASVYPNALLAYPSGKTQGPVAVLQPGRTPYNWQVTDFQAPDRRNMVVYELLVRDFSEARSFQAVIDSLPYLRRMGINALQLMPVKEFPGQESWGYNPAHFTALEKAYGTPNKFKELVDLCHASGIAVILDVVFNHTQEDNPVARLWWDDAAFRPAANSPFLNPVAKHPFNVFFDFNHESQATKDFMDRVCKYWLREFKIDGFRFDLSKGFTQTDYGDDVGAWSSRDEGRIAILKSMATRIWSEYPNAYIILEHFADNAEERELANYTNAAGTNSLMLWGNLHGSFKQNVTGFASNSDIRWMSHQTRGWDYPGAVGYMESHDEERQAVDAIKSGNTQGDVRTLATALQRIGAANALMYAIPGPKMLWQFGELGYDYSINYCLDGTVNNDCRVGPKPVRWDYVQDADRYRLYRIVSAMIDLHTSYDIFATGQVEIGGMTGPGDLAKYVKVSAAQPTNTPTSGDNMNVVVMANLDVRARSMSVTYPHTGTWYNYFTGQPYEVTTATQGLALGRGEFVVLTDYKVNDGIPGFNGVVSSAEDEALDASLTAFPNPASGMLQVRMENAVRGEVTFRLTDLLGREVRRISVQKQGSELLQQFDLSGLRTGAYLLQVITPEGKASKPIFKQ
jgi:1,4-alpha-glucan branching enzyme